MNAQPNKPVRPDSETLQLAIRLANEVFESPALGDDQSFRIEIELTPGEESVLIEEPERRSVMHLLSLVRKFDMPTHDVRLERLFEIVERIGVPEGWHEGFVDARAAHQRRNDVTDIQVQDPEGPPSPIPIWITPREAFELWAYGEVIHEDYAKEVRWRKFGPTGQGMVRQLAYDYLDLLLRLVAFTRALLLDLIVGSTSGEGDRALT